MRLISHETGWIRRLLRTLNLDRGLLSYTELVKLVEDGVIEGAVMDAVNSSSIDIHLGRKILVEDTRGDTIVLREKTPMRLWEHDLINDGPFTMEPGVFILGHSTEIFHLPLWLSCTYSSNSSMGRSALEHMNSGWCDAGWHGSTLTLELKNISQHHNIVLQQGDVIGQLSFFKHTPVPLDRSYAKRGRYNGDKSVQAVKDKGPESWRRTDGYQPVKMWGNKTLAAPPRRP